MWFNPKNNACEGGWSKFKAFYSESFFKNLSVNFPIKYAIMDIISGLFFNQIQTRLAFYQLNMDIISFPIKYEHH